MDPCLFPSASDAVRGAEPVTPGERRLAHPPSDRYRPPKTPPADDRPDPGASVARGIAIAVAVAGAGAVAIVVLGGVLTVTTGLIIVAGAIGCGVGAGLRFGAGPPCRRVAGWRRGRPGHRLGRARAGRAVASTADRGRRPAPPRLPRRGVRAARRAPARWRPPSSPGSARDERRDPVPPADRGRPSRPRRNRSMTGGADARCTSCCPGCGSSTSRGRPGSPRTARAGWRVPRRVRQPRRAGRGVHPHDRHEPEPPGRRPRPGAVRTFFEDIRGRGVRRVSAVTWPGNRMSVAFHRAMGFAPADGPGTQNLYGTPAYPDYDADGDDRVVFSREI